MTEIKSCPFCNGKVHIAKDLCDEWRFYHTCKSKPQINIFSSGYKTKQEAIDAWNRRMGND